MSRQNKINNGNYMGDQENHQKETPKSDNKSGNGVFKRGELMKGVPAHEPDSFPAHPHNPQGLKFQDMRDQDPATGKI